MKNNIEMIIEYIKMKGLSESQKKHLYTILNHYSTFQEKSLYDLIEEAENEEDSGKQWKRRTLKKRLTNYTVYLKDTMMLSSAKTYLIVVKAFYRHYEIEIHTLPKFNSKNAKISKPINYKDLPDVAVIKKCYDASNPIMRAIILLFASTGLSRIDLLNLSVKDFLEATFEYHETYNVKEAVEKMLKIKKDIIGVFELKRQKTNKHFTTFCTPEAVNEILNYLKIRLETDDLLLEDVLFKINYDYLGFKFRNLNDMFNLGRKGTYNRFRPHMLRKFHASNLLRSGMALNEINALQGKSKNKVDEAYMFEDPEVLKQHYIEHMGVLLINSEVNMVDVKSAEFLSLEKENKELKVELKGIRDDVDEFKKMFNV